MGSIRAAWNAVLVLAVLAGAVLVSQSALGQGITTGSIAGTIVDQQGVGSSEHRFTRWPTASPLAKKLFAIASLITTRCSP